MTGMLRFIIIIAVFQTTSAATSMNTYNNKVYDTITNEDDLPWVFKKRVLRRKKRKRTKLSFGNGHFFN